MIRRILDQLRPYRHAKWEVFFMRLLFALSVYYSLRHMLPDVFGIITNDPGLTGLTKAKEPVGIGRIIDLTFLADRGVGLTLHWILLGALLLYVCGIILPVSALVVFAIHCAVFTLNNSKGATHHGYQILSLTLLAQVCVLWAPMLLKLAPKLRQWTPQHAQDLHRRDLFVFYSQVAIAGCYVIAALSKLLRSHVKWIIDSPNVAVQIVKSHSQKYYEYLQPEWADMGMTYANWITAHPWLTRIMLTSGLMLELFAFLMLINRAWALFIGVSMIIMHLAIGELMGLHFPQNIESCFAFLVNAPFWLFAVFCLLRGRRAGLRTEPRLRVG